MASMASIGIRISWLALLCTCAIVVGSVAPALIDADGAPFDFMAGLVLPVMVSVAPRRTLAFALNASRSVEWAWFATPPFRPPIVLS
jgi:hypothetical protein